MQIEIGPNLAELLKAVAVALTVIIFVYCYFRG